MEKQVSERMISEHLYIKLLCEGSILMCHEDKKGDICASTLLRTSETYVCV